MALWTLAAPFESLGAGTPAFHLKYQSLRTSERGPFWHPIVSVSLRLVIERDIHFACKRSATILQIKNSGCDGRRAKDYV